MQISQTGESKAIALYTGMGITHFCSGEKYVALEVTVLFPIPRRRKCVQQFTIELDGLKKSSLPKRTKNPQSDAPPALLQRASSAASGRPRDSRIRECKSDERFSAEATSEAAHWSADDGSDLGYDISLESEPGRGPRAMEVQKESSPETV